MPKNARLAHDGSNLADVSGVVTVIGCVCVRGEPPSDSLTQQCQSSPGCEYIGGGDGGDADVVAIDGGTAGYSTLRVARGREYMYIYI